MPVPLRVVLLQNIPNPHMSPVFRRLGGAPGIDLDVLFLAATEGERDWQGLAEQGFRGQVLEGRRIDLRLRWDTLSFHVNPGLAEDLARRPFDVLVNAGWASPSNWIAFGASLRLRRAHVIWAGSTHNEPGLARSLTLPAVRYLVRHSDAVVSHGTASRRYLVSLGADADHVVDGFHCIDTPRFLGELERYRGEVSALRGALGLGGRRVILTTGRLIARKGIDHLIEAYGRLHARLGDLALVIVGDGRERPHLEALARRVPEARVVFCGHVPLDRIAAYYLLADVFVLPSPQEIWGLVLNEAALTGLPLVATEACGAAADLIEPGLNGFRVPPADPAALAVALENILSDPGRARVMGAASKRLVGKCTPDALGDALAAACRAAAQRRGLGG